MEWTCGEHGVSTDKSRLSLDVIHGFLKDAYWSKGRTRETVELSILNSFLCYGLYAGGQQVGFARVATDLTTHFGVSDVFVLEGHRGRGLGTWLMELCGVHTRAAGNPRDRGHPRRTRPV